MIIKTFRAESSSSALKRVKVEMGGDAIVLKTNQTVGANSRPVFEVTACLENPTVAQSSVLLDDNQANEDGYPSVTDKTEQVLPETLEEPSITLSNDRFDKLESTNQIGTFQTVYDRLKEADFEHAYLEKFIGTLAEEYDNSNDIESFARNELIKEFEKIKSEAVEFKPGDKIILLGPAGCGKSSVIGKLTASLVTEKKHKVRLITLDDLKMAAYDEIATYAEILGVNLSEYKIGNEEIFPGEITLVDSPATPIEQKQVDSLKEKIDSINSNYRLMVLSALIRSRDIKYLTELMSGYQPTHLVITKADLTQSYGAIFTAAHSSGVKILYLSNSPGGMGRLNPLDSKMLAEILLRIEDDSE